MVDTATVVTRPGGGCTGKQPSDGQATADTMTVVTRPGGGCTGKQPGNDQTMAHTNRQAARRRLPQ